METTIIGYNTKLLRLYKGFSQPEMAELFDTTRDIIASIESGRTKNPDDAIVDNIQSLARKGAKDVRKYRLNYAEYPAADLSRDGGMTQEASENYKSQIKQKMNVGDCMKALQYAEMNIANLERLLTEKERVIQLLSR